MSSVTEKLFFFYPVPLTMCFRLTSCLPPCFPPLPSPLCLFLSLSFYPSPADNRWVAQCFHPTFRVYLLQEDTVAWSCSESIPGPPLVMELSILPPGLPDKFQILGGRGEAQHQGWAGNTRLALAFPSPQAEHFSWGIVCVCVCVCIGYDWNDRVLSTRNPLPF